MTMVNHEAGIHHLCTRPHDMTGSWTEAPLTRKMPCPLAFLFNCICGYTSSSHLCMLIFYNIFVLVNQGRLSNLGDMTDEDAYDHSDDVLLACDFCLETVAATYGPWSSSARQVYIWLPKAVKILESASQLQRELCQLRPPSLARANAGLRIRWCLSLFTDHVPLWSALNAFGAEAISMVRSEPLPCFDYHWWSA